MARIATLIIIAIFYCIPMQAQLGDIIKNKKKDIKDKVEDRTLDKVDDKIDDAVDDVLDSIFGVGKSEESSENEEEAESNEEEEVSNEEANEMMNALKKMAEGGNDVEVRESFQFDNKIVWRMDSDDGKSANMTQFVSNSGDYTCVETSGIISIQDFKKNQVITITDENTASVMSLDMITGSFDGTSSPSEEMEQQNYTIESTNQTKTIAGYKCNQVRFIDEDEETTVEIWFAKDVDGFEKEMYRQYMKNMGYNQNLEDVSGTPMEMSQYEKGKLIMHMVVEEISTVNLNYDMSQYEIMDMSMFGNFGQGGK